MLRVPLEWLKEYVPIRLAPEELAQRLTLAGFEVTGIESVHGEPVFSLEVTPNRADCLSILGIAREVAAMTGTAMKLPWRPAGGDPRPGSRLKTARLVGPNPLRIEVQDREGCRRYIGRLIEHVQIGPSPDWMQRRLAACGIRAINNIVDITNYVLLELGQPLHAFDYGRLAEAAIVVRRAAANESIVTLDGERRTLSPGMLIIADAKRPIAVAGVMGGRETEITASTTRILLESAEFDPILVRRTARQLGLASESSYRFERGVDPEGVELGSERASSLIAELARGQVTAIQDVGIKADKPTVVLLDPQRIQQRLGVSIPARDTTKMLKSLGFELLSQGALWRLSVPSFRRDVKQDVDVIEEVARSYGYDRLPTAVGHAELSAVADDERLAFSDQLRTLLTGLGLSEVITWSLISHEQLSRVEWSAPSSGWLRVSNPLSQDHAILRPTLLPGMLQVVSRNAPQGATDLRLFELGNVFDPTGPFREAPRVGLVLSGAWERSWQGRREADLYRARGLVEQLAGRASRAAVRAEPTDAPWAEPGQAMRLLLAEQPLGVLGEVSHTISKRHDCPQRVWFAELCVETLRRAKAPAAQAIPPSPFPPVKRDLSIVLDKKTECEQVFSLIRTAGAPLVGRVELVDRYTGSQVPAGKHSLTFAIEYRDPAKTLTAAEVDVVHQKILRALTDQLGALLR